MKDDWFPYGILVFGAVAVLSIMLSSLAKISADKEIELAKIAAECKK